jgi:hypothetical protein
MALFRVQLPTSSVQLSAQTRDAMRRFRESQGEKKESAFETHIGERIWKLAIAAPSELPLELELRAFRMTKGIIGWQKWLIAFAMRGFPAQWAILAGLAAASWIAYFALRRRLPRRRCNV